MQRAISVGSNLSSGYSAKCHWWKTAEMSKQNKRSTVTHLIPLYNTLDGQNTEGSPRPQQSSVLPRRAHKTKRWILFGYNDADKVMIDTGSVMYPLLLADKLMSTHIGNDDKSEWFQLGLFTSCGVTGFFSCTSSMQVTTTAHRKLHLTQTEWNAPVVNS